MKAKIAIVALVLAVVAQASWRADVTTAPIPAKPVSGALLGKSFVPKVVTLKKLGLNSASQDGKVKDRAQAYALSFASDSEFFPAQEVSVWFSTNPGEKLVGKSMAMKPYAFGTEEHRRQSYGDRTGTMVPRGVTAIFTTSTNPSVSDSHSDRYSIQLSFIKQSGKSLQGKVYLSLPDKAKSFLTGTFTATVE